MKIGILTHTLSTNYGGLLQNYALQIVLKELGHNPETLNHIEPVPCKIKILSVCSRFLRKILKGEKISIRSWPTKKEQAIIAQNTSRFVNSYIQKTDAFNINKMNADLKRKYDAVIVGSDQVWNPRYIKAIQHFYLSDFNDDVIKMAYAASFGSSEWMYNVKDTRACMALAQRFKAISVRESSGVDLCKANLHVDATWVLDPTLLIDRKYYEKIIANDIDERALDGDMMVYILDKSQEKQSIIEKVAMITATTPYSIMAEQNFREVGKVGIADCVFPSVSRWLKGFAEAKFVVTDSFHGTVFSIIFNKPFIAILNKQRGEDRFISLLRYLGLESRLVNDISSCQSVLETPIDYNEVEQLLKIQRSFSLNFLTEGLH